MTDTSTDKTYEVDEDTGVFYVGLKLAHPLSEQYARNARAKTIKDYKVGETVWVSREYGNAMIDAGMVQVDPTNKQARRQALFLNRRDAPLTMKEIAAVEEAEAEAIRQEAAREVEARRAAEKELAEAEAATAAKKQAAADAADAESSTPAKSGTKGK